MSKNWRQMKRTHARFTTFNGTFFWVKNSDKLLILKHFNIILTFFLVILTGTLWAKNFSQSEFNMFLFYLDLFFIPELFFQLTPTRNVFDMYFCVGLSRLRGRMRSEPLSFIMGNRLNPQKFSFEITLHPLRSIDSLNRRCFRRFFIQ